MAKLSNEQVEAVVQWMNTWDQLKGTAIPIRFKEDWGEKFELFTDDYIRVRGGTIYALFTKDCTIKKVAACKNPFRGIKGAEIMYFAVRANAEQYKDWHTNKSAEEKPYDVLEYVLPELLGREQGLIKEGSQIKTVRRKSDGEVFSIGDEVKILDAGIFYITKLRVKENYLQVCCDNFNVWWDLKHIKKANHKKE
jgi:hypothetical protein